MGYTVSQADLASDRDSVLRIWTENVPWFTPDEHVRRFDWYLQNPHGPNRIFLAHDEDSGTSIGTIGIALRAIDVGERRLLAGNAVDIAVDAEHRTVQPALLLARAVKACLSAEMPLIWATPNESSTGVLLRAGFKNEGEGYAYTKRLSFRRTLRQHGLPQLVTRIAAWGLDLGLRIRNRQATQSTPRMLRADDPALGELLASGHPRSPVNFVRTPELLHWVYEQSPYRRYVFLGACPDSGTLSAAAFCYERRGCAVLDDLVYRPDPVALSGLIGSVLSWAAQAGCVEVRTDLADPDEMLLETLNSFGFDRERSRPLLVCRHSSLPADFRICGGPRSAQKGAFPETRLHNLAQ